MVAKPLYLVPQRHIASYHWGLLHMQTAIWSALPKRLTSWAPLTEHEDNRFVGDVRRDVVFVASFYECKLQFQKTLNKRIQTNTFDLKVPSLYF